MPTRQHDFFQAAWVVGDMEKAIRNWVKAGVGPFIWAPHVKLDEYVYHGHAHQIDYSVAIAQSSSMQIELICQHDDRPSHYRDVFAPGEAGMHHLCRFTDGFDLDLAHFGAEAVKIAAQGRAGDARFAYLDTRATIGCMTEIIEETGTIRGLFDLVRDAATSWDGREAFIKIGS